MGVVEIDGELELHGGAVEGCGGGFDAIGLGLLFLLVIVIHIAHHKRKQLLNILKHKPNLLPQRLIRKLRPIVHINLLIMHLKANHLNNILSSTFLLTNQLLLVIIVSIDIKIESDYLDM